MLGGVRRAVLTVVSNVLFPPPPLQPPPTANATITVL